METIPPRNDPLSFVIECTFSSHFGAIVKIKDCGSKTCSHSDNYEKK